METWVLLDVSNLCHIAHHSTGDLQFRGTATGVLFGFFRKLVDILDLFRTPHVAFCFDGGYLLREQFYPDYKANRVYDDKEQEARAEMKRQMRLLRDKLLADLGYRNVFYEKGFEGDDLIGAIVRGDHTPMREFVIVSNDQDMYQLLNDCTRVYDPRKNRIITLQSFYQEFHLTPSQWARAKAIAGCDGDNVKGVRGVAIATATKYILNRLKHTAKSYQAIEAAWEDGTVDRNMKLVRLPWSGCPIPVLVKDSVSKREWEFLMDSLGIRALRNFTPFGART